MVVKRGFRHHILNRLLSLSFTETFDGCASSEGSWCWWNVSTTCCCLAAFLAFPNSNNCSSDRCFSAEWTWIFLALRNFNLLYCFTERSAIANTIFTNNSNFLCSSRHSQKGGPKPFPNEKRTFKTTRRFIDSTFQFLFFACESKFDWNKSPHRSLFFSALPCTNFELPIIQFSSDQNFPFLLKTSVLLNDLIIFVCQSIDK